MCLVVRVWVVGVHELDRVEDTVGVESVIVLIDVILHHRVEEVPSNVVIRSDSFVGV